ncbi:MAG: PD40 domain-containing protein [Proteobacteria bacterium]|nr:PD40 domain-containing protein [Pseudomonadota bacterium]
MSKFLLTVGLGVLALVTQTSFAQSERLLLRYPTISRTQIAFNYGGDLWIVGREGGDARRLTSGAGVETFPHFSPDGTLVAFTGEYEGNQDIYVIPAAGGVPRRLTYHPGAERALGWTPDGKQIVFASDGSSFRHHEEQLYTIAVEGGLPTELPLPIGDQAAFAPDGKHVAYVPHPQWQAAWKRYHGGQTWPIWIADLKDSSVSKLPRENSNDYNPMWVGDQIYFLSDRAGPVSLFVYDAQKQQVSEALHSDGFDFKTASASADAIVIEQFGAIRLYDLHTHQASTVNIRVSADLPTVRPHFVKVEPKHVVNFNISPSGARAVMEVRGEIFTIPTDKGDIRNLTRTPGTADRNPAWSPDGKSIAYFSDASGEYELYVRDQSGQGQARRIDLGDPAFYYDPLWSPDSRKILYTDQHLNLGFVDLDTRARKHIDQDYYTGFQTAPFGTTWSPDSQWVAYTRQLISGQHAVFLYSLAQGKSFQVTDGMSDALFPAFDANGKYLYFTASTDIALTASGLDMSSDAHPTSRSVYLAVLNKDDPSPVAPESDEEKAAAQKDKDANKASPQHGEDEKNRAKAAGTGAGAKPTPVKIDLDGIGQRIVALPIPMKNYTALRTGKTGVLFLAEGPPVITGNDGRSLPQVLQKFDLGKRKLDKFVDEINDYRVAYNGEKLLYRHGDQWQMISTEEPPNPAAPPRPGIGPLKLDGWEVYVDPRAAWQQIYDETWRIERDFFYDPHYHGLDLAKAKRKYAPFLAGVASRDELTYLFNEALGELSVGHLFVGGGETPQIHEVKGGLLGADYRLDSGRYRIARIFNGENWNPGLQAPLTQPGVNVAAGDYLLAVNGRELHSTDNVYSFFEATAGKQVVIKVGPHADGQGAREVTVVPVESEEGLRHLAWIEDNRRKVDQASGGRVAYVYVPNTAGAGFTSFNRYFFSQVGKEGVIIDERFNEGGQLADYIVDYLRRPIMSKVATRDGHDWTSPSQGIYGPKVMLINEMSGSGGDALPWYFRKAQIGPLIGKRTWGGLVGIWGYPELIDGGGVTAPRAALYGLKGDWEVENHGIPPDYEVELDPAAAVRGHDSQLDKAIEVVMQQLEEHPVPQYQRPAYPNYHEHDDLGSH